jgi:SAM-dependent methyltransferase
VPRLDHATVKTKAEKDPVVKRPTWTDFERAGWERHVDAYHAFFEPISEQVAPAVLDAVRIMSGDRLLDVCCGPGYLAAAADERGAKAYGTDIAQNMIALATKLHPQCEFRQGDASGLPWPDGFFAAVVCNFGLHHISDPPSSHARVRPSAPCRWSLGLLSMGREPLAPRGRRRRGVQGHAKDPR